MRIVALDLEDARVADLFGLTVTEIQTMTGDAGPWRPMAVAIRSGRPAGAVMSFTRPDLRTFLRLVGDPSSYGALAAAAADQHGVVFVSVDHNDTPRCEAMYAAGFEIVLETETFRIAFDRVLSVLSRARLPSGYAIHRVTDIDEDAAFRLDTLLRNDVPGTDGWVGDRDLFHAEIHEDPEFDADAYLIASHGADRVGLVRVWRRPTGPAVGMVGVRRSDRGGPIAAALLARSLTRAAEWGFDTFLAETSLHNRRVHPMLSRAADESVGRRAQMILVSN